MQSGAGTLGLGDIEAAETAMAGREDEGSGVTGGVQLQLQQRQREDGQQHQQVQVDEDLSPQQKLQNGSRN